MRMTTTKTNNKQTTIGGYCGNWRQRSIATLTRRVPIVAAIILLLPLFSSSGAPTVAPLRTHGNDEKTANNNNKKKPRRRPNIVLFLTDDQDVALGGLERMPNLHRLLRAEGTEFPRSAFTHTPVCCPSRSSMLTGRYLHNVPVRNNSRTGGCDGPVWRSAAQGRTLAVHARAAGYRTAYAGKYLNTYGTDDDDNAVPPGWDEWFGLVGNSVYYDYQIVESRDGGKTTQRLRYGDEYATDYLPNVLVNRTLDILDKFLATTASHDDDDDDDDDDYQPFLLVLAWPTPHAPFTPAPWAAGAMDGRRAPRTPNWNASAAANAQKHWLLRRLAPVDDGTASWIDDSHRRRLEALLSVDDHIAQVVQKLETTTTATSSTRQRQHHQHQHQPPSVVLDDTFIIYTSDNGFQLGQHRLPMDKRHLYEHDIRVPLVVRGPGIPRHATSSQIVLNVDIAPTIYYLVNGYHRRRDDDDDDDDEHESGGDKDGSSYSPPADMDGESFLPLRQVDYRRDGSCSCHCHVHQDRRTDFLISYHGEGDPDCGMFPCPPPPPEQYHGGWMPDAFNNTYHCVRTLIANDNKASCVELRADHDDEDNVDCDCRKNHKNNDSLEEADRSFDVNTIYCEFDDDEHFVEYYDMTVDQWQLDNQADSLSIEERTRLQTRLHELRTCQGASCRRRGRGPREASSVVL